ncbi:MAG TPA: transcriptional repressor [Hyphomicrobium sp.]|nr:transcriptional repressor [Hyphomicrobium sp.]HRO49621.1 transcriptional repressor [Hyphomicrobium sp.]
MSDAQARSTPFPSPEKPNGRKLAKAVERAGEEFAAKNLRFTKLRQMVYEEIAATYASIGAYEILNRLADKGTRVAPISIYRAIDALLEAGVIHRLESKNAFFACRRMDHRTGRRPLFLSCEKCGAVGEVDGQHIFDLIGEAADGANFTARVKFVEVQGLCPRCAASAKE